MRIDSRPREQGYNLMELLIAMALLGTLLMSILTLFVFGRRNVYSGKQLTRATSVTTQVIEDLQPVSVATLHKEFLITSSTPMTSPTVAGVNYTNVVIRSTDDDPLKENPGSVEVPAPRYLTRWADLIAASTTSKFQSPRVTVVIDPEDLKTSTDPTSAAILRIRVVTEWSEGQRQRNVTAELVKLNREF